MADGYGETSEHLQFMVDLDHKFTCVNRRAQRVLGYTHDELIDNMTWAIMRPNEDLRITEPALCEAHADARKCPGEKFPWRTWTNTKHGDRVWLEGDVWWDTTTGWWVEDCVVFSFEQQLPLFNNAAMAPREEPAQSIDQTYVKKIDELAQRVHELEAQQTLPGTPSKELRSSRKFPDKDQLLHQLHTIFAQIDNEADDKRGPHGGMAGRVTIGRVCWELGKISRNTLEGAFDEFGMRHAGESLKTALERVYEEYSVQLTL